MRSDVQFSQVYSARLTGNQFLYNEFKVMCGLFAQGLSKKEATDKIMNENLFEYRSMKAIVKHIGAVWERVSYLDDYLLDIVLHKSNELGKLVNFYAILKYDLLFLEFMEEVILEKKYTHQMELSKTEISNFFSVKSEQSDTIANFKEATLKRLRAAYIEILQGANYIIKKDNTIEINIPTAIYQISGHLEEIGEKRFAKAMLGA